MSSSRATPASSLPSLMMPCPGCGGRMLYWGRRVTAPDLEDTVFTCRQCGCELVRTSMRKTAAEAA